ncbi:MAG: SAM-dependent methyltransferase [Chloroflexota bacterium]|nr:MAG: SAM-dependent methyltransferase [Chloroflexota bacterium]
MTHEDRIRWDAIYRQRGQQHFPEPDPFLFDYTPPTAPGDERRALDIAGGQGQNGLWLAEQGYIVDVMDISRLALARGRQEMVARGLRSLNFLPVDLDTAELEAEHYDLVCVFRYLKRELFPALRACVRPGGRIVYETYNLRYREIVPAFNPAFLLQPGELAALFAGWKLLHAGDVQHISRLVALKPGR